MAKKKITLETLAAQMAKGFASVENRMEKSFAAVADDITDIKRDMATKEQVIALHTQVNSIETQLRGMKHAKLQARVADLEEEVFGDSRA
jgi:hypothetical protein